MRNQLYVLYVKWYEEWIHVEFNIWTLLTVWGGVQPAFILRDRLTALKLLMTPESLTFSDLRFSPKMFKTILQLDPDVMSCISQEYMWVKMLSGGETRTEMQPGHMVTPNALQTVDSLSLAIRKETNWDQLKEKNDSAAERRCSQFSCQFSCLFSPSLCFPPLPWAW